jgi:catechol 2,3-dioxygenase-like lactoylglutathione lyase family enzyme
VERNDFLRRFIDRNGPGPHHLTFKVQDLAAAVESARAAGYEPVGIDMSDPGWQEAFLHPKDAPGIVVQLAQSSHEGEWSSPPPAHIAALAAGPRATLVHVAHAVARMQTGIALFGDLLGGRPDGQGATDELEWVDLDWPGGNRVRLLCPTADGPLADWLSDRAGRLHHLGFVCPEPADVPGAKASGESGIWAVGPDDNFGVRLLLAEDPDAYQSAPLGR